MSKKNISIEAQEQLKQSEKAVAGNLGITTGPANTGVKLPVANTVEDESGGETYEEATGLPRSEYSPGAPVILESKGQKPGPYTGFDFSQLAVQPAAPAAPAAPAIIPTSETLQTEDETVHPDTQGQAPEAKAPSLIPSVAIDDVEAAGAAAKAQQSEEPAGTAASEAADSAPLQQEPAAEEKKTTERESRRAAEQKFLSDLHRHAAEQRETDEEKKRQKDAPVLSEMAKILASDPKISTSKLMKMLHIGRERAIRLRNQIQSGAESNDATADARPASQVEPLDAEDVLGNDATEAEDIPGIDEEPALEQTDLPPANPDPREEAAARQQAEKKQEQESRRSEPKSKNKNAGTIWGRTLVKASDSLKKIREILEKNERDRTKRSVDDHKNVSESRIKVDENGVALEGENPFEGDGRDELRHDRRIHDIENTTIERFFNPSLLHIEGEFINVEKQRTDAGNTVAYAFRDYRIKKVSDAIAKLRSTYGGCSTAAIIQLVMLRAGLGIDVRGKLVHTDPKEYEMTADQFFELCRDIQTSQERFGHPFGLIEDANYVPGVRSEDSPAFVLIGKTKCYPLGYMPADLFRELSEDPKSALYGVSASDMYNMLRNTWLFGDTTVDGRKTLATYEILCDEASKDESAMFQLKAIDAMMRAIMKIDNRNPEALGVPAKEQMQTLMMMRLEQEHESSDPNVAAASEVRHKAYKEAYDRQRSRFRRDSGERKRTGIGDRIGGYNMLTRASRALRTGILLTTVPENLIGMGMQGIIASTDAKRYGDEFSYTPYLRQISETDEGVECLHVYTSLYKLGGKDMVMAFRGATNAQTGASRFKPTVSDMTKFLSEIGVNGDLSRFGVKPGQEKAFMSQLKYTLDDIMLSSNLMKKSEAGMFVQLAMNEMGRSAAFNGTAADDRGGGRIERQGNRESYTSMQVENWARHGGAQELFTSLMDTDAGWEAFMTLGNTTLGRKSPIDYAVRTVMAKNRLTELLIRTCFDRYPEYGINKVYEMLPFSNTISYLVASGVASPADIHNGNYALANQMGGTLSFREGLLKNLVYDTVMAGERLTIGLIYAGTMMALGGLHRPPDDRDRYTWSEWIIGEGEDATPIKWAWWMDDISGIGFPLGTAFAIMMSGGTSEEAAKVFINAIANLNNGTALFDAIDMFNNFDEEVDAMLGRNVSAYDPDFSEWLETTVEMGIWKLIGDATPAIIGEIMPWSRDWLGRGDRDAHTASRIYDAGEGSRYSMDEAVSDNRTVQTPSYREYMRRRSAQSNILQAWWYDLVYKGDNENVTGYMYSEQPLDTMVDPYVQAMYNQFYLDLDPATSDLPIDQAERQEELYARAEVLCQYIDENYENPTQAALAGFVINPDARVNAINYCYHMMNEATSIRVERLSHGYLDSVDYQDVWDDYWNEYNHWNNLLHNYFQSDTIPWSLPRYVRQESDRETRYVDDQGNPMTWFDTLGPNPSAHAESYWYGNPPGISPFSSPRTANKGYNFETLPGWLVLDAEGNPVNDVEKMYDNAADLNTGDVARPGYQKKNIQELMWGGQGTNAAPESNEQLNIDRSGNPTINERPWRIFMDTWPEWMSNLSPDAISEMLGIPSAMPNENGVSDADGDPKDIGDDGYDDYDGGGSDYYGGRYSYGGGSSYYYNSGGSSYTRTPNIYSTPHQVYSSRPSGIKTGSPYSPNRPYLRPSYTTSGSRKPYSHN